MKIKISLVSLLLAFVTFTFAQEAKTYSDVAGVNTAFVPNNTWDNWFIQLGAGPQWLLGDDTDPLFKDMNLNVALAVGRWWTPLVGARIKGQFTPLSDPFKTFDNRPSYRWINAHVDVLWNVSQYFGKYNAERKFSFIPYGGVGAYITGAKAYFKGNNSRSNFNDGEEGITVHAGLMFQYRLSKLISIHADVEGTLFTDDQVNRVVGGMRYEGMLIPTLGLTFNLGKSYFEVVQPMDEALINDLNNKINDLRAENELLSKRPERCDPCPEVKESNFVPQSEPVKGNFVPNVVLFRINSAVVDANQRIGIYNTAQFIKNSGEKVKVVGYADKKTGTAAGNLKLSEQRAKAVAKELTSRYGIPSDKIVVEWKGSNEQPYSDNAWNRVVIMSAQ